MSKAEFPPYFIQQYSVFVMQTLSFTTYPEIHLQDFEEESYLEKLGQAGIVGLGVGVTGGSVGVGAIVGVGVFFEHVQEVLTVPSAQ